MILKRAIILGSGYSIREGQSLGLFNSLKTETTFSINDNIKFVDSTVTCFGDWTCYASRHEWFKKHPLVIGRWDTHFFHKINGAIDCPNHKGLILLKASGNYTGTEGLQKGLYTPVLTGVFCLHLAICLGYDEIFLLGMDAGGNNGVTHWYQGIEGAGVFKNYAGEPTTGVGLNQYGGYNTSFYNNEEKSINDLWKPFTKENVKIYNVSMESRIQVFQKLSYKAFLRIIDDGSVINQDEERLRIREQLKPYNTNEGK